MMVARKPDAAEIERLLRDLPGRLNLGPAQRSWPAYLFHVADIENAVRIIGDGVLLSRQLARERMARDTAHREIIDRTDDFTTSCARLYFRPRTPTAYRNEGFRPQEDPNVDPQGIPIMFVFDSLDLLTRHDTTFTDGNSGSFSRVKRGSDFPFLSSIPFELVYHDGSFPIERRDEIVFHRNAEVLIPNHLDIDVPLRFIMVRSEAELQTLLSLLRDFGSDTFSKVRPLCRVNLRSALSDLFVRRWTFVESVTVSGTRIVFNFSPDSETPEPFAAQVKVSSAVDGLVLGEARVTRGRFVGQVPMDLPGACAYIPYLVELFLDGRLAFRNRYSPGQSVLM